MQRIEVLAHGQMRQVRKRRENAGVQGNLAGKLPLARAHLLPTEPIRGCNGDIAGRSEKNLCRDARGGYEKGKRASNRNRNQRPPIDSRDAFRERDPKQREKRRRVMKVNRPLRRTPGKKVLEKNRRGD